MKRIFRKLECLFLDLKLNHKIALIYSVMLIIFISFSFLIFYNFAVKVSTEKVKDYSKQVLKVQEAAINNTVTNLNNISKMIMSNSSIQDFLRHASPNYVVQSKEVFLQLITYMDTYPIARYVTLYDKYQNEYGKFNPRKSNMKNGDMFEQEWYSQIEAMNGKPLIKVNIYHYEEFPDEPVLSFIRIINDIETQKPIGVLVLDVLGRQFLDYQSNLNQYSDIQLAILDEYNQTIFSNIDESIIPAEILSSDNDAEFVSLVKKINGKKFIFSGATMPEYGWRIVSVSPLETIQSDLSKLRVMLILLILFNIVILSGASILISRSVTTPINKLVYSMSEVRNGTLKKASIRTGKDEIGRLKDKYNTMIDEINCLIERIVQTQKDSRQYELNALYEQIKPHFLYNTLDSIGYLILSGDSDLAYTAIENLGSYYRTTLSKGDQTVTIAQEVSIVTDYLELQKLRYGNIFDYHFYIQPEIRNINTLKLILQPIVENSLYHGIRPSGISGKINICVTRKKNELWFIVHDTGIGMDKKIINQIVSDNNAVKSFGLKGTIERIKIFYSYEDCYEIISSREKGTTVIFKIPYRIEEDTDSEFKEV